MKISAVLIVLASTLHLLAQEARYYRIVGPVPTTIISLNAQGELTWTNSPTNATFTVQTTSSLAPVRWTDWTQVAVTNTLATVQIFAVNPPPGMVLIPAGSFTMGDNLDGSLPALPLHTNCISAFFMDRCEITKARWDGVFQWATNHGYSFVLNATPAAKGTNHPVYSVNWFNYVKWCNARSEMEGLDPCYYTTPDQTNVLRTGSFVLSNACVNWTASGYRLPTEAEWERAARGGAIGQRFPWGNTIAHTQANYFAEPANYSFDVSATTGYHPWFDDNGTPYTSPVGTFAPNAYGLQDMAGNLWEWCWDAYDVYSSAPQTDPHGPDIGYAAGEIAMARTLRGGAWGVDAMYSRCADRANSAPINATISIGARCVRTF